MRAAAHLHEMLLVTTPPPNPPPRLLRLLSFLRWAITSPHPPLLFTRTAPVPPSPHTCLKKEVQLVQAAPRDTSPGVSTDKRGRPSPPDPSTRRLRPAVARPGGTQV